jgi:mannose-6-phosphate isomerase-like protein (cupin superfamily)
VRILSIVTFVGITSAGIAAVAIAQQPSQPRAPQPDKTFTSAADVEAMIAKAKAERKPDQANFLQPLLRLAPYAVNLEYRVEGVDTPATVHEKEAELIYVVDGAGTLTTGGKLVGEKRTNATNLSGSAVEGGTPQRIAKGDYVFVPENTPHSFTKTQGRLVIMSVHVPRTGRAN